MSISGLRCVTGILAPNDVPCTLIGGRAPGRMPVNGAAALVVDVEVPPSKDEAIGSPATLLAEESIEAPSVCDCWPAIVTFCCWGRTFMRNFLIVPGGLLLGIGASGFNCAIAIVPVDIVCC